MKTRILLVEDDEFISVLVRSVLDNSGYEVVVAQSLDEVKQLESFEFAGVISDFQLPGGDGCDVVAFMRERIPGIPALLMSGYGNWVAENCASRGVENVRQLEKPFRTDQLVQAVEALIPAGTCPQ